MRSSKLLILTLLAGCLGAFACADSFNEGAFSPNQEDPELGKSLFEPARETDGKEDALRGRKGLKTSVDRSATAVWEVKNLWTDIDTPAAREAGVAWEANSGLTWDEKYASWVDSMKKVDAHSSGATFQLTTPFGKVLPAPSIECAETSLFLRAAFASWYQLPFFVEAKDAQGQRLYLGHFGFRTASGKYANSANFRTAYKDYSDIAQTWRDQGWPQDQKLRGRRLGGSQDDMQPALFEGAHAGAYFDEIFLNKRTGYFMIYLLSYFGSVNLADPSNTFNLKPEATRAGDTLLQRWQRRGIGHTLVVKKVSAPQEGFFEVELVSGSMPRRQPKWESASSSKYSLTAQKSGGPEMSNDDVPFAKLGGGIKRWRVATPIEDRWTNIVPPQDQGVFIRSTDFQAIGARIETYENLIVELPPEQKREAILERIIAARDHLSRYPASCAARLRREEAFVDLYTLEREVFFTDAQEVDATYRRLEDYVFSALSYEESKTCCWNKSTAAMYEIIMDYAEREVASAGDACVAPSVFKASQGGYELWANHAMSLGRDHEWAPWSEDEFCPQRDVRDDVINVDFKVTDYCSLTPEVEADGEVE